MHVRNWSQSMLLFSHWLRLPHSRYPKSPNASRMAPPTSLLPWRTSFRYWLRFQFLAAWLVSHNPMMRHSTPRWYIERPYRRCTLIVCSAYVQLEFAIEWIAYWGSNFTQSDAITIANAVDAVWQRTLDSLWSAVSWTFYGHFVWNFMRIVSA